jgi:hypothetical protein
MSLKLIAAFWLVAVLVVPSNASAEDDRAIYTEYLPGMPPNCDKPLLDVSMFGSTLETCQQMYQHGDFASWTCEEEALYKQKINPSLITQSDIKWLVNVMNRKRACIALLARTGKLSVKDKFLRWWNGDE